MLILHLAFVDQTWLLWGESPATPSRRRKHTTGTLPLPFGAAPSLLTTALADLGIATAKTSPPARAIAAQVPTRGEMPLASHPLIQDAPGGEEPVHLQRWTISCLPLTLDTATHLLVHATERDLFAPGVRRRADLGWLVWVLRFAADLVMRQRIIPSLESLESRPAGYRAVWRPILLGSDEVALAALMKAMPASVRAYGSIPEASSRTVTTAILTVFVDSLMRQREHGVQPPSRTHMAIRTPHDRWLDALSSADGHLPGSATELAAFATHMREC